ncbi:MAG TPA: hypothetical protein VNZ27_07270 [Rhodanobacter sp.]|jgi:hypothetical protein|nr:hypothetical protein [Rhodanobacter sp.]
MSAHEHINKTGKIIAGPDYVGWKLKIKDDQPNTSGYLILIWSDEIDQGYDDWVGSKDDLDGYLSESGWTVEWD